MKKNMNQQTGTKTMSTMHQKYALSLLQKGTVAKKIDDFATEIKSVKLHHACEVSWDKKGYPV